MKRNVLTAPVLKTVRWGLMCLALCLASMPANAADEMANTLVYAGENEDTINPLLNNHQELPTIIFSGLMKYDAKGQPVPELAESFTYDKGTHTYAFKLRGGVKWHDGKPLTVEDILFTYEALTKDKTLASSITSNYEDIKSITAPDAQTVVFTLSKPNAAMLDNFTIGILPKHLLAGKDINTAPANQHPVGTGRYKFVEWDTAGGIITLEKNKDYYGKVPNIDRIVYKTVAVESTKALMLSPGSGSAWPERQVCGHVPGQGRLQEHRLRHRRLPFRRYGFPYRLLEAERRLRRRSELRPEQGRHRQKRAERPGVPCVQPHPDERLRRQQGRGHLPLRSQEIRRRNGKARLEEGQGRHLRAQRAEVLVHDSGPGL